MKAVIYTRISRYEPDLSCNECDFTGARTELNRHQKDESHTGHTKVDDPTRAVKRQEESCRALAKARGWKVVTKMLEYSDEDLSGFKEDVVRDGYERLKVDVLAGKFSPNEKGDPQYVVIADSMTRVGRNRNEIEHFVIDVLDGNSVAFSTAKDPDFDTSTATGRLVLRLLALLAQFESEQQGERIRGQRRAAAQQGGPSDGGRRAFGFEDDKVTINETEAKLIRDAADRFIGGESAWSIARDWEKQGIRTPAGNEWRSSSITRMLRSARVNGRRTHHSDEYDAEWDAILDDETRRDVRLRGRTGSTPKGERWLLTGVLLCGECGQGMNSHSHKQGRRYRCVSGPGQAGCGKVSIQAQPLEEQVWSRGLSRSWDADAQTAEEIAARLESVKAELRDVRTTLTELDDSFWQRKAIPRSTYDRQAEALRSRATNLETEVDTLREERAVADEWTSALKMVEHHEMATEAQRRALLARMIDSVQVTKARPGKWFQWDRVTVNWVDGSVTEGPDLLPNEDAGVVVEPA